MLANLSAYCLVVQPRQHSFLPTSNLDLHVGGSVIEVVDQWPHLGHIITNHCTDDADIFNRRTAWLDKQTLFCATLESCHAA